MPATVEAKIPVMTRIPRSLWAAVKVMATARGTSANLYVARAIRAQLTRDARDPGGAIDQEGYVIRGELRYTNKRGAGCVRYGDAAVLAQRLKTLRCEADLYVGDAVVGGCNATDHADDGRVKWNWWYDPDAVGAETT